MKVSEPSPLLPTLYYILKLVFSTKICSITIFTYKKSFFCVQETAAEPCSWSPSSTSPAPSFSSSSSASDPDSDSSSSLASAGSDAATLPPTGSIAVSAPIYAFVISMWMRRASSCERCASSTACTARSSAAAILAKALSNSLIIRDRGTGGSVEMEGIDGVREICEGIADEEDGASDDSLTRRLSPGRDGTMTKGRDPLVLPWLRVRTFRSIAC